MMIFLLAAIITVVFIVGILLGFKGYEKGLFCVDGKITISKEEYEKLRALQTITSAEKDFEYMDKELKKLEEELK